MSYLVFSRPVKVMRVWGTYMEEPGEFFKTTENGPAYITSRTILWPRVVADSLGPVMLEPNLYEAACSTSGGVARVSDLNIFFSHSKAFPSY
jgi:hypothetical protein